MKLKTSRAFSLTELSIVVLVVGILVAGTIESSRLIKQFQLSTARTLTKSSPVNSIKGLVLWLDATSETSLTTDSAAVTVANTTNDLIYNWDDQNPQQQIKLRFTEATTKPTYIERGINNIPTLYFNASSDGSTGNKLSATSLSRLNVPEITVFIVYRPMDIITAAYQRLVFYTASGPARGFSIYKYVTTNLLYFGTRNGTSVLDATDTAANVVNNSYIISATRGSRVATLYKNGTSVGTNTDTAAMLPAYDSDTMVIGSGGSTQNFDGYISEIIMFDNLLLNNDRKAVEKYLGKKYAIAVAP